MMLGQLLEIEALFDQLARTLAALKIVHSNDPDAVARLEMALTQAKRGAELARAQARTGEQKVRS